MGYLSSAKESSKKVLKAFFAVEESDSANEVQKKVATTALKRIVYEVADYWLTIVSGAFIIVMDQEFGYGAFALFMLMWAFDIIVANCFVVLWKRTGEDVTLGESYRRAVDALHDESYVAGRIAFAGTILKAAFWDGPEQIVIFFHKEIKTEFRMMCALLFLTALQAAIWTPIYVLGFETVQELTSYIFA